MTNFLQPSPALTDLFPCELRDVLAGEKLLAVLTIEDPANAVPLARALIDGGVHVMELAWRTPETVSALEAIRRDVPEMVAGIGTLLSTDQMQAARAAGAAFGVSPGLSTTLLERARALGFPYAPGVMTPSELQVAIEHGCRLVKYFPAESAGGLSHLRGMNAPFAHLRMRYIVLGGLTESNAGGYLQENCVSALGGSWIAPSDLIARKSWDVIAERAKRARRMVDDARPHVNGTPVSPSVKRT